MKVYVVTYDSDNTVKWVKGVYADRADAEKWVDEAIEIIGGDWERFESDQIISYELSNPTRGIEQAKYKIQERPVQ